MADGGVSGDEQGEAGAEVGVEEQGHGAVTSGGARLRRRRRWWRRRGGHCGSAAASSERRGGEGHGKRETERRGGFEGAF